MHLPDLATVFRTAYAVIWDMDGILVDSESYHFAAHTQALKEYGITLTEEYYKEHGVSVDPQKFYAQAFLDAGKPFDDLFFLKIHYQKIALYQKFQRELGIKLITPAVSIVKKLYNKGVLMAIASQVDREEVIRHLRGTSLLEYFPVIVSGGDFGLAKKPAPDIYQKAAQLLNVPPQKCIAIEDSLVGVNAALAAGIPCLVVPNHFTQDQSFSSSAIKTTFEAIASAI